MEKSVSRVGHVVRQRRRDSMELISQNTHKWCMLRRCRQDGGSEVKYDGSGRLSDCLQMNHGNDVDKSTISSETSLHEEKEVPEGQKCHINSFTLRCVSIEENSMRT